jgi:hypothetical protein
MKSLILVLALALSAASAFAQICEADMVDNRGRILETMRAYSCQEAMKQCRVRINDLGMRGFYDCVRHEDRNPGPQYPGPQTGTDARRMINNGESVVVNNQIFSVIGVSFNGLYAVRSNDVWGTIINNVRRENLSVMNGCNLGLCVSDSVIDISTAAFVKVIGLSFDDRFVTRTVDVWNTITSGIDRSLLAETKGCISSRYSQICVGNQVINRVNSYSTVVGIQLDGRVVLRSNDVWNTLTPNVDPSNLIITR